MSLINEALKKAQRLRGEEAADSSGSSEVAPRTAGKRGQPQSANTMVLLASGALVLVVLSVVFTVYLVNRPAKPVAAVATSKPGPAVSPAAANSGAGGPAAPAIMAPQFTPVTAGAMDVTTAGAPAAAPTPSSASTSSVVTPPAATPVATTSAPPTVASHPAPATAAVSPAAESTTIPPAAPTLAPGAPDERVAAFVEAIRVTGIRSSGAESRVLMNERVYRVNDIVERTLGVRLIKAAADSLTFSDSRGVTYSKNF
jgi:hypothetical protein